MRSTLFFLLFSGLVFSCEQTRKIDWKLLCQDWVFEDSGNFSELTAKKGAVLRLEKFNRIKHTSGSGVSFYCKSGEVSFFRITKKRIHKLGFIKSTWMNATADGSFIWQIDRSKVRCIVETISSEEVKIRIKDIIRD